MSTETEIRTVLVIVGSLRERSYNRALARAAQQLAPQGLQLELAELHDLPLYNGDLDNDEARPRAVVDFKQRIDAADAVLWVSPEYNYGVPGVVKNAIDWASRPGFQSVLAHKPCGLMGASMGTSGTMRGQEKLKSDLMAVLARIYPHRGVAVNFCGKKFDDDLELTDEGTRDFVADYLAGFAAWL